MKGKISSKARRIFDDHEASSKLMNYVVRGKDGRFTVGDRHYKVTTAAPATMRTTKKAS